MLDKPPILSAQKKSDLSASLRLGPPMTALRFGPHRPHPILRNPLFRTVPFVECTEFGIFLEFS